MSAKVDSDVRGDQILFTFLSGYLTFLGTAITRGNALDAGCTSPDMPQPQPIPPMSKLSAGGSLACRIEPIQTHLMRACAG
jgi:hypothetical protein